MNIAYSCNDYYIPQTGISLISLFENNKDVDDLTVYFISKDVSEENIIILREITNHYHRNFKEVKFDDIAFDLDLSDTGRHIATIYTKVFFSRIEGVDKMIYLDSDTVIVGPLKYLWEENIDDYYMGVVETLPTKFYNELGLPKGERFFNDGMAVCNVAYCRKNNLIDQVLKVVNDYQGKPPTLSEGALNKVCFGKVKYFDLRYNLMSGILYMCSLDADYMSKILHSPKNVLVDSCKNPIIIHYLTGFYNRPWFVNCTHPYKSEYLKYKAISPWQDAVLTYKPMPLKLKMIDYAYRLFGLRTIEFIRSFLKDS